MIDLKINVIFRKWRCVYVLQLVWNSIFVLRNRLHFFLVCTLKNFRSLKGLNFSFYVDALQHDIGLLWVVCYLIFSSCYREVIHVGVAPWGAKSGRAGPRLAAGVVEGPQSGTLFKFAFIWNSSGLAGSTFAEPSWHN